MNRNPLSILIDFVSMIIIFAGLVSFVGLILCIIVEPLRAFLGWFLMSIGLAIDTTTLGLMSVERLFSANDTEANQWKQLGIASISFMTGTGIGAFGLYLVLH